AHSDLEQQLRRVGVRIELEQRILDLFAQLGGYVRRRTQALAGVFARSLHRRQVRELVLEHGRDDCRVGFAGKYAIGGVAPGSGRGDDVRLQYRIRIELQQHGVAQARSRHGDDLVADEPVKTFIADI